MYEIYGFNTFNTEKVLLTAEELGIKYHYEKVDLASGANKSPEYLQIHPLGKTPTLIHDGNILIESAAICRYLARANEHHLYSREPLRAAEIDAMMDFSIQHVGRYLSIFYYENVVKRQFFQQDPDATSLAEAEENLSRHLPYLEQILSDRQFLCGDDVTIADTIAFPYFKLKELAKVDLATYENILRWYNAFRARPSVSAAEKTMGPGLFD